MTKVALYARVSTAKKKEGQQLKPDQTKIEEMRQNPENQLIKLREYCNFHGYETSKELEYVDRASGKKSDRPALSQLLEDAQHHKFDTVAVVRLDRFGRSARNLTNNLFFLNNLKIGFVCSDQPISLMPDADDPMGKFLLTILSAVAELELDLITERINDGLDRARLEGKKLGRPKAGMERKRGETAHVLCFEEIVRRLNARQDKVTVMRELSISESTYYRLLREAKANGWQTLPSLGGMPTNASESPSEGKSDQKVDESPWDDPTLAKTQKS